MREFLRHLGRIQESKYIKREAERELKEYLTLKSTLENPPEIHLEVRPRGKKTSSARDIAIAAAYQCYAPGITRIKERKSEKAQGVAERTLKGGHHTTRLHPSFMWHVNGVSRGVVHDVFHSFPFYNTEQQSQRYVKAKEGSFIIPSNLTEKQRELFVDAGNFANSCYFELLDDLRPEVEKRVKAMYPEDGWNVEKTRKDRENKIEKLSQEVARYILPIAQKTTFYYTLSELQLLRLFRATKMEHYSDEARYVIAKMVDEVRKKDKRILEELDKPLPTLEREKFSETVRKFYFEEFDKSLRDKQSILQDYPINLRNTLSTAVRNVLGVPQYKMSESEAISLLVDPSKNKYLSDVYDVGMLDPLTSTLREVSLTFKTRLSHTADSQRQRHRRTPGSNATLEDSYTGVPDYIIPMIIKETPRLRELYEGKMVTIYKNVREVINSGVSLEYALTLLPNAHAIRVVETGDLFDWAHRWKQRLCYLAQEEIFFISVEQVEEVRRFLLEAADLLLAPCGIRQAAGVRPRCPEGDRWCGQPVYQWQIDGYKKNRLI